MNMSDLAIPAEDLARQDAEDLALRERAKTDPAVKAYLEEEDADIDRQIQDELNAEDAGEVGEPKDEETPLDDETQEAYNAAMDAD